jgi:ATP-binding cassette subfamily F protein uup
VGDVQDWLTQSARSAELQRASAPAAVPAAATATSPVVAAAATPTAKRKLSYKEQRELDALPALLKKLEAEQAEIDVALNGGALFASDAARAAQLGARHAEIEAEWLQSMERWEALGGS